MRTMFFALCAMILVGAGCSETGKPAPTGPAAAKVKEQAEAYAKEWPQLGMWLPNAEQIGFFTANFDLTKEVLASKLSDPDEHVRQPAAYVIEKIGPVANSLQSVLAARLAAEKVPIVRIYLCNALRAVGGSDPAALAELRKLVQATATDKDTLEQRIYAAAALSTLSQDPKEVASCTDYVCTWLKPPATELKSDELKQYWDLRWAAVNAVEFMKQAQQAIPLLESMQNEPDKRSWVDVHVPRALASLNGTPAPPANTAAPAQAVWTPPANPDLQQILNEAQADMIAGRYEEALAKHVWFYENALKVNRAFYGVRLSFALSYWKQLGLVYPPAKVKLEEYRNEAEKKVTSGQNVRESFHDFMAINSVLGDEKRTVALFKLLDKDHTQAAKSVFDIARPVLIKAGDVKLCSKYVDAKTDYPRFKEMYEQMVNLAKDPQFGEQNKEFAQHSFTNEVTTLVALLVVSDRKADAEKIASDAKTVLTDQAFAEALDEALKGKVPEPWPPSIN